MTAEEAAEWGKTLSFEKVWAALMETRANLEEDRRKAEEEREKDRKRAEEEREKDRKRAEEEHKKAEEEREKDRKRAEEEHKKAEEEREKDRKRAEEFDKGMAALRAEVDKTTKNINGLSASVGELMQKMVATRLWDKFRELGYEFSQGSECRKFIREKRVLAEADVFLENGIYAMAVEVKTKLEVSDVDDHLERMDIISKFMRERGDRRELLGAVAGGIVSESALNYAQKKGFFVIAQNGEAVEIAESPGNFKPRIW
jgi:ATPase subunit of ABC transporter with duplicated ATPase domains